MTSPFGAPSLTVLRRPEALAGDEDLRRVLEALGEPGDPVLLLGRCTPTAAFSRRDTLLAGHAAAVEVARDQGFEPVVRPVGGHLAAYDEGSLVVHLFGHHPDPRRDLQERFRLAGDALVEALTAVGVPDARVGPVPGEYCDGAWSVNAGGTAKLAGTGQRLRRDAYLFSAVVTVTGRDRLAGLLTPAYEVLGLPLDPATIGTVEQHVAGVRVDEVREAVAGAFTRLVQTPALRVTA